MSRRGPQEAPSGASHAEVFTQSSEASPTTPCGLTAPARHSFHVVAWCVGGRGVLQTEGRLELDRGLLYLLPAGTPHMMSDHASVAIRAVGFCSGCLRRDGLDALLRPFDRVRQGASLAARVDDEALARLEGLFRQLEAACAANDELGNLAQRAALTLVLTEVARATARAMPTAAVRDPRVAEALRIIEARCLEGVGLREVAGELRLSPSYLTTRVREETGQTVQSWIIAHRMAEARRLLQHGDELVEIVAERVGYTDATHFTRMFRRHHGLAPGAWRALHRG